MKDGIDVKNGLKELEKDVTPDYKRIWKKEKTMDEGPVRKKEILGAQRSWRRFVDE